MERIREKGSANIPTDDRSTRPTGEYEDVTNGESSTMEWVTLPFRAFVRGFRESLRRA